MRLKEFLRERLTSFRNLQALSAKIYLYPASTKPLGYAFNNDLLTRDSSS